MELHYGDEVILVRQVVDIRLQRQILDDVVANERGVRLRMVQVVRALRLLPESTSTPTNQQSILSVAYTFFSVNVDTTQSLEITSILPYT